MLVVDEGSHDTFQQVSKLIAKWDSFLQEKVLNT